MNSQIEKELLRRSAGLKPKDMKKLNENANQIKTLDLEAELLNSCASLLRSLDNIKYRMGEQTPRMGMGMAMINGRRRDEKPDIGKLRIVAKDKLKMIEDAFKDAFDCYEDENEEEE